MCVRRAVAAATAERQRRLVVYHRLASTGSRADARARAVGLFLLSLAPSTLPSSSSATESAPPPFSSLLFRYHHHHRYDHRLYHHHLHLHGYLLLLFASPLLSPTAIHPLSSSYSSSSSFSSSSSSSTSHSLSFSRTYSLSPSFVRSYTHSVPLSLSPTYTRTHTHSTSLYRTLWGHRTEGDRARPPGTTQDGCVSLTRAQREADGKRRSRG